MKLSIIIVSFNTKELLQRCLSSLYANYKEELFARRFEIIVIENASTDGSRELLQKKFPQVKLITNKSNSGFAKANNQGVTASDGELVLFLNPDTEVNKDVLTRTAEYLTTNQQAGIVTCKVILPNGNIDDACHRGFPTPWRALTHFSGLGKLFPYSLLFNGYHLGYRSMDKIHEIEACAGAFLMIKTEVGKKSGWFDEDYFWYGDDLDLCYRVKQAGFKIMYIPDVSITHLKGGASGIKKHSQHLSKADTDTRRLATQARFDVMRVFYKKHYQYIYPRWLTSLVLSGIFIKQKFTEALI